MGGDGKRERVSVPAQLGSLTQPELGVAGGVPAVTAKVSLLRRMDVAQEADRHGRPRTLEAGAFITGADLFGDPPSGAPARIAMVGPAAPDEVRDGIWQCNQDQG